MGQIISLETKEGHEYLIKLDIINPDILPVVMEIPVVNITIERVSDKQETNNARTLFQIANAIRNYADQNDVILYCYCDSAPILKRDQNLLNQEFRSKLFMKMFEKQNSDEYLNEQIIVDDPDNGKHYIHLFSKVHNKEIIEVIASKLNEYNK